MNRLEINRGPGLTALIEELSQTRAYRTYQEISDTRMEDGDPPPLSLVFLCFRLQGLLRAESWGEMWGG